ncbi:DNA_topoisomerase [Hexamita inflata]|uniref:DNA topoisomerase n=1 Tax=Hexamita inflata TaxID=28002 RepID=A0AA86UDT6_9EUKA|nr:DNA topoisomerase [Hexamita inflata]
MTLFIAEKPSIAKAIAIALGKHYDKIESPATPVYKFNYNKESCTSTSVAGHLFGLSFTDDYQSWDVDEQYLFENGHVKKNFCEGAEKILAQLKPLCDHSTKIVLALDDDTEGENICFEIVNHLGLNLNKVVRMRFSALTEQSLVSSYQNAGGLNLNQSLSVDVRQELDLKIGVAFTRFLTKYLQRKYSNVAKTISYGPCQTPTLSFCIDRKNEIENFVPQESFDVKVSMSNGDVVTKKFESKQEATKEIEKMKSDVAVVTKQTCKKMKTERPVGMNTINMLMQASEKLQISPKDAMVKAEHLYSEGYLTYPRTESTHYPDTFDFKSVLTAISAHKQFQKQISSIKQFNPQPGFDAGDHPPITPTCKVNDNPDPFYLMICNHFVLSLMKDEEYEFVESVIQINDCEIIKQQKRVIDLGFNESAKPTAADLILNIKQSMKITKKEIIAKFSAPLQFLSESNLLSLLEQHRIGTDASIATHITNIVERNYVKLENDRQLVPTQTGDALIAALSKIDKDLVSSSLRSQMEADMQLIACGKVQPEEMKQQYLKQYLLKFQQFKIQANTLDFFFSQQYQSKEKILTTDEDYANVLKQKEWKSGLFIAVEQKKRLGAISRDQVVQLQKDIGLGESEVIIVSKQQFYLTQVNKFVQLDSLKRQETWFWKLVK